MKSTDYKRVKQFIIKNLHDLTTRQMFQIAKQSYGYNSELSAFKVYVSKLKKSIITKGKKKELDPFQNRVLQVLGNEKVVSIIDLCDELSFPPNFILQTVSSLASKGYEISYDDRNIYFGVGCASVAKSIEKPLEEDTEIIFGAPSDIHFGSKACQITALNEFCEICRKQGVKYQFVAGDVFAGRPGR